MISRSIEMIYQEDIRVRNRYSADPAHRGRVDFPPEVAKAMVVGRELYKSVQDPETVAVRTIESSRRRHVFVVTEEHPEVRPLIKFNTDECRKILNESLLTMADPNHSPTFPPRIMQSLLGFNILAHWALHSRELSFDNRSYNFFEPFLFVLNPQLRGMSVGPDSLKRLEAAVRRLRYDVAVLRSSEKNVKYAARHGFIRLSDLNSDFRSQFLDQYSMILNPEITALKPLNLRLQRYNFPSKR